MDGKLFLTIDSILPWIHSYKISVNLLAATGSGAQTTSEEFFFIIY